MGFGLKHQLPHRTASGSSPRYYNDAIPHCMQQMATTNSSQSRSLSRSPSSNGRKSYLHKGYDFVEKQKSDGRKTAIQQSLAAILGGGGGGGGGSGGPTLPKKVRRSSSVPNRKVPNNKKTTEEEEEDNQQKHIRIQRSKSTHSGNRNNNHLADMQRSTMFHTPTHMKSLVRTTAEDDDIDDVHENLHNKLSTYPVAPVLDASIRLVDYDNMMTPRKTPTSHQHHRKPTVSSCKSDPTGKVGGGNRKIGRLRSMQLSLFQSSSTPKTPKTPKTPSSIKDTSSSNCFIPPAFRTPTSRTATPTTSTRRSSTMSTRKSSSLPSPSLSSSSSSKWSSPMNKQEMVESLKKDSPPPPPTCDDDDDDRPKLSPRRKEWTPSAQHCPRRGFLRRNASSSGGKDNNNNNNNKSPGKRFGDGKMTFDQLKAKLGYTLDHSSRKANRSSTTAHATDTGLENSSRRSQRTADDTTRTHPSITSSSTRSQRTTTDIDNVSMLDDSSRRYNSRHQRSIDISHDHDLVESETEIPLNDLLLTTKAVQPSSSGLNESSDLSHNQWLEAFASNPSSMKNQPLVPPCRHNSSASIDITSDDWCDMELDLSKYNNNYNSKGQLDASIRSQRSTDSLSVDEAKLQKTPTKLWRKNSRPSKIVDYQSSDDDGDIDIDDDDIDCHYSKSPSSSRHRSRSHTPRKQTSNDSSSRRRQRTIDGRIKSKKSTASGGRTNSIRSQRSIDYSSDDIDIDDDIDVVKTPKKNHPSLNSSSTRNNEHSSPSNVDFNHNSSSGDDINFVKTPTTRRKRSSHSNSSRIQRTIDLYDGTSDDGEVGLKTPTNKKTTKKKTKTPKKQARSIRRERSIDDIIADDMDDDKTKGKSLAPDAGDKEIVDEVSTTSIQKRIDAIEKKNRKSKKSKPLKVVSDDTAPPWLAEALEKRKRKTKTKTKTKTRSSSTSSKSLSSHDDIPEDGSLHGSLALPDPDEEDSLNDDDEKLKLPLKPNSRRNAFAGMGDMSWRDLEFDIELPAKYELPTSANNTTTSSNKQDDVSLTDESKTTRYQSCRSVDTTSSVVEPETSIRTIHPVKPPSVGKPNEYSIGSIMDGFPKSTILDQFRQLTNSTPSPPGRQHQQAGEDTCEMGKLTPDRPLAPYLKDIPAMVGNNNHPENKIFKQKANVGTVQADKPPLHPKDKNIGPGDGSLCGMEIEVGSDSGRPSVSVSEVRRKLLTKLSFFPKGRSIKSSSSKNNNWDNTSALT